MKYNYIFITPGTEERLVMYGGIEKSDVAQLLVLDTDNPMGKNLLFRILYSKRTIFLTSHKIKNCVMKFLLPKYKRQHYAYFDSNLKQKVRSFSNEKKLCFIITASLFFSFRQNICSYIREKFPDSKCVIYMVDVISSYPVESELIKKSFDKCFSFDKSECKKYGFTYCLEPFSYYMPKQFLAIQPEYDVTFIGRAKDRLDDILAIYEKLKQHNLRLDFYIFGVSKKDWKYTDEIHYNTLLSFNDFLFHTLNAHCTLEVLQKDGSSPTTRFSECMLYKRKLLTNCTELLDTEWSEACSTGNIQVYDNFDTIDYEWIKHLCEYDNKRYIDMFSTDRMLETIDYYL